MKKTNLVEYGAQTLSNNPNYKTFRRQGFRDHIIEFQANKNARSSGSTPVAVRVNEKEIVLSMAIFKDESRTLEEVFTELNRALEDGGKSLRILRTWDQVTPLLTDTGWNLTDDAVNRSLTYQKRWLEAGIQFDADVSVSGNHQATLTNESLDGIDLSDHELQGNFETWLDLNEIDQVTGVKMIVGSDSANYRSYTFTKQADESAIVEGRNKFSVAWSDMDETGAVDPGLIGRYCQIQVQYTSAQIDIVGIVFGGIIWQAESDTMNFKCYSLGIEEETQREEVDYRKLLISFSAYRGIGEGTNKDLDYIANGISAVSNDFSVSLGGSYTPEPIFTIKFTAVTNLSAMTLYNKTTGDVVTITRTWTINDILEFNTVTKTVKVNNVAVDYTSVLPRFQLGKNKLNIALTASGQSIISQLTNNTNLRGEIA